MNFGYLSSFQSLDKGIIERIGPTGFSATFLTTSTNMTSLSSGLLHNTVSLLVIFAIMFLTFFSLIPLGFSLLVSQKFIGVVLSYCFLVSTEHFDS